MEVTEWHDSTVMEMEMIVVEVDNEIENNRIMKTIRIEKRDGGDICGYRGQRTRKCASLKL